MDDRIQAALRLGRAALAEFPVADDADVVFVKYRENVVLRVDDGPHRYALRIARPGYRTDAQLASEVAYVRALGAAGVRVPDFVATTAGRDFAIHSDGEREHQIVLQRWVEDAAPLDAMENGFDGTSTLTADDFARIGALAARMHEASRRVGRPDGYDRPAWDADGLVGPAPLWGDPRLIAELSAEDIAVLDAAHHSLARILGDAGHDERVYGVLHADFTPENILRAQNGDLLLIDFDDFGEGWYAFDLATPLFFFQPHPGYADYRAALEAGYASASPHPDRILGLLDAMLLARGLTYLGWAAARRGDETAEFLVAEVRPMVLDLARAHLAADYRDDS